MAGPEDSTSSTHHGNADNVPDRFLHDNDLQVDDDESMAKDLLKDRSPDDIPMQCENKEPAGGMKSAVRRKVGFSGDPPMVFSDGSVGEKQSATSQAQDSDSEDKDVFDRVTSPQKIFFVEDDDDDESVNKEDEEEPIAIPNLKGTVSNERKFSDEAFYSDESDTSDDEDPDGTQNSTEHFGRDAVLYAEKSVRRRSQPIAIEHPKQTSGMSTSCRHSLSQVFVRCQISPQARGAHMPHPLSCPAFSPRWRDVIDSSPARAIPRKPGRPLRRRNTVSSYHDMQKQRQIRTERQEAEERKADEEANKDWKDQHGPAFRATRSRSYSDTDVNYRLMKEVGRELRRISDEFQISYSKRQLTTVSESADEGATIELHSASFPQ